MCFTHVTPSLTLLTLDYDVCSCMDIIYAVSCETGILATVLLLHILYVKSSRWSYRDPRVTW